MEQLTKYNTITINMHLLSSFTLDICFILLIIFLKHKKDKLSINITIYQQILITLDNIILITLTLFITTSLQHESILIFILFIHLESLKNSHYSILNNYLANYCLYLRILFTFIRHLMISEGVMLTTFLETISSLSCYIVIWLLYMYMTYDTNSAHHKYKKLLINVILF